MKRRTAWIVVATVLGLFTSGLIVGVGAGSAQPLAVVFQVDPEAQVTKFAQEIKNWEPAGKEVLQLSVTVKNISDQPKQFKITVKAEGAPFPAAAFLPVSGKPPQLAPQKEGSITLPLYYDKFPKNISVRVEKVE